MPTFRITQKLAKALKVKLAPEPAGEPAQHWYADLFYVGGKKVERVNLAEFNAFLNRTPMGAIGMERPLDRVQALLQQRDGRLAAVRAALEDGERSGVAESYYGPCTLEWSLLGGQVDSEGGDDRHRRHRCGGQRGRQTGD